MKALFAIGGRLAIICTVAALVLALVNAVTAPVIVENRERALEEGLQKLAAYSPAGGLTIGKMDEVSADPAVRGAYPLRDASGELRGCILQLVGVGYGGDMQMLAGFEPSGRLFAATLMENQETPGLGKKAESPGYMDKFIGKGATEPIPTGRDELPPDEADAVTGATITFLGIANALHQGSEFAAEYRPTPLQ